MPTLAIRDRVKELRRVPARDLLPNPRNWRRHPESQANALRGLLSELGFSGALLVREVEGGQLELIDGHLRAETVPDMLVPVLVLDVDEAEAAKLLATFDPLGTLAEADTAALESLLAEVQTDSPAVRALLDGLAAGAGLGTSDAVAEDPGPQLDRAAELQALWATARGQLWEVPSQMVPGKCHRLLCGDSTEAGDVARLLAGAAPHLCVTDPPYGVEYDPAWRQRAAAEGHLAYAPSRVGEVPNDDRADWSATWKLVPGDVIYSWHPPGATSLVHAAALQDSGFVLRMQIIWAKSNFPIGRGDYHVQHEPCWYAVRKGKPSRRTGDRTQTTLWKINLDRNMEGGHSTQKPVECMARPMRNHEGDVYDPFLGSGTTLVATEQLGRVGYGCEIDAGYTAVCLQRLQDMGLAPRLVEPVGESG